MSQKPGTQRAAAEKVVKEIRRATRKQHSAEEKRLICGQARLPGVSVSQVDTSIFH